MEQNSFLDNIRNHFKYSSLLYKLTDKGIVSEETVVLRRWRVEKNVWLINRNWPP